MVPLSFASFYGSTLIRIPMICAAGITGAVARRCLLALLSERPPESIHILRTHRRSTIGGSLCRAKGKLLFSFISVKIRYPQSGIPVNTRIVFCLYLTMNHRDPSMAFLYLF